MEIKKVWAVYFSATGTTKKIVTHISKQIANALTAEWEEYCFNLPDSRKEDLQFSAFDLVVIGTPVYAGRVPNLLMPYIRDHLHGSHTLAVPVVLYGNRNFDDALIELRNLLTDQQFLPLSAGAFVGEHAFSKTLGAQRPKEEDLRLASCLADETAEKIKKQSIHDCAVVQVDGCEPLRPYFTPRDRYGKPIKDFLKAKPVTDRLKCTNCGLCAAICPLQAIDYTDVAHIPGTCMKCCACVKRCPEQAKAFTHEGFLYHQHELEEQYGDIPAESKIFV